MAKLQKLPAKLGKWSIGYHPHFWHQLQSSGFPRPVRVDDIFEGCRELTEISYTHSHGLLQQKETLKSAKRIGTQRGQKSKCAVESWTALLSQKQCAMTHTEYCHLGELIWVLVSRVFTGAQWTTWLTALMADFLVSSLSGSRKDTMWPRAPGKQSYSS